MGGEGGGRKDWEGKKQIKQVNVGGGGGWVVVGGWWVGGIR